MRPLATVRMPRSPSTPKRSVCIVNMEIVCMYIGHIVQYVAHSISVNLDEVSVRLWNENGT